MKLTNRLTGGIKTPYISLTADCTYRESFLMWALIIPTIFLGIWPASVLDMLWETSSLLYIFIFINISPPLVVGYLSYHHWW